MSLTNSLQYQNGIFEGGNGFNAFSCGISFVMENFCHIGNDEYYGYNFTDIIIQKIIIHCCISSIIEVDIVVDTK